MILIKDELMFRLSTNKTATVNYCHLFHRLSPMSVFAVYYISPPDSIFISRHIDLYCTTGASLISIPQRIPIAFLHC